MEGRGTAVLALATLVLAGIAYLTMLGAPNDYWITNAAALVLAVAAILLTPSLSGGRARHTVTLLLIALLFLPLVTGPYVNGIARWLPLGPFAVHSGALALPPLVVLAARDEDFAPSILLGALLAASLQPDAATGLAVMLAAVGLYNATGDWRLVPVAGIALLASMVAGLRGELPAQPFVERILIHLAIDTPLAAFGLVIALLVSFFLLAYAIPAPKPVRHALAGALFGFSLAALVSNYPTILVGYGAAPILGFGLAIGLAITGRPRRATNGPAS